MRAPTVADVMASPVVTVETTTPFKQVATLLAEQGISAVAVVDGVGRPVGVVSELDLVHKESERESWEPSLFSTKDRWRRWNRSQGVTAQDIMTAPMVTVPQDEPVATAARRLTDVKLRRLFVVDEAGRLVGVFARRDVVRMVLRPDEEIRARIEHEVLEQAVWADALANVTVRDGVVTLSGIVDNRSEADRAGELARSTPGVVDVRNHLRYAFDDVVAQS